MEDKAKEENPRPMNMSQKEKMEEVNSKKGKGRSLGNIAKVKQLQVLASQGGAEAICTAAGEFTPVVVTVEPGEDLVEKVWSLGQKNGLCVCIFTATGSISKVDLAISRDCILKVEGISEILYVKGSDATQLYMKIATAEGKVYDGTVRSPVIAAGRVQVIAGTFGGKTRKRKYQATDQQLSENQEMMSMNHLLENNSEVPTPSFKLVETNDHVIVTSDQDDNKKKNDDVDQSQAS